MYDSENIEWAEENDATVRYICARTCPEWQTLRRFRKANRQWIEQCLAHLLNQSRARRFAGNGDRPTGHIPILSKNYLAALGCARRRVELAIMMDTAASD
jgi:predicted metal-dependent hydrolase